MNRRQRRAVAKSGHAAGNPASGDAALPSDIAALLRGGVQCQQAGCLAEAEACYRRVLAAQPGNPDAFYRLGTIAYQAGRAGLADALQNFEQALALKPDYAEACYSQANALLELKRFEEALTSYDRALTLKPGYAEAFNGRGNALQQLKRLEEALASFDRALAITPDYADALNNRGNTLRDLTQFEEALASYNKALALEPSSIEAFSGALTCASMLCDWGRKAALASGLAAHVTEKRSYVLPFTLLGYSGDPSLQLQCARNFSASRFPPAPWSMCSGTCCRNGKLRIAYLSADFRQHPVAYLTGELFELHDRSRFEVIGLSFGADDGSALRRQLAGSFDRFIDVRRMDDEAAAKLLYDLETDIAVDLTGYTYDFRPGILAYRPAPVQAAYLGYPGTTGASFIDYIVADSAVAPFAHQPMYSEKIVQLPDCYQVNDSKRRIAERTPSRQEAGLPEEGFVFCCFNGNWKIMPEVFDVWMRLLHGVRGSVLWLRRDYESSERNLRREAEARGIDPARLVFAPRLPSAWDHLARHRLADLFLDTLPYNAHTTASDALWAGLPVLTQLGQAFAGRVAGSLLRAVGMPELITHSLAEYEALALRLANEPALLEGYKNRLQKNRLSFPLFDTDRFRRHIETAYLQMREICSKGESPRSFKVDAEGVCTLQ
jgi:protein O-GlcNAc transferase